MLENFRWFRKLTLLSFDPS